MSGIPGAAEILKPFRVSGIFASPIIAASGGGGGKNRLATCYALHFGTFGGFYYIFEVMASFRL